MKVLMLGWELPPHNSGGLGVACYQLCKAISKKAIDIEFVLPYQSGNEVDFMRVKAASTKDPVSLLNAVSVYKTKTTNTSNNVWNSDALEYQKVYEQEVEKIALLGEFDIIHAHDWLTFRAGLKAKQVSNRPLILHVHSIESDRAGGHTGNLMVREIEGLAFLLADRIIAVSERTKKAIVHEYRIPADKIDVVHNSLDPEAMEPLDTQSAFRYIASLKAHGYKVVVNVGRLTIQKGLPNLLQAAQKVLQKMPSTVFLIVGSGEQYHELIELAAQLGISQNVIYTGFLRGKQLRDAFAIGDIFVMPSISEPFGLTPLEAAAYNTPSLISKQSGVSEVLRNCLKVDYWDIDEMANQITAVVQNEGLLDTLKLNLNQEYDAMNWQKAADAIEAIYARHAGATV